MSYDFGVDALGASSVAKGYDDWSPAEQARIAALNAKDRQAALAQGWPVAYVDSKVVPWDILARSKPSLSLGTPSLSLSTPSAASSDAPSSASYYPSNPSYLSSLNLGTPTLSMPSMSSPTPSAPVSDGSWNPSVLAQPPATYSINGKRVTKEEFEKSMRFWNREAFAGLPVWQVAAGAGSTLALLGLAFLAFRPRVVSGGVR